MSRRIIGSCAGVLAGIAVLAATIWLLSRTLGNLTPPPLYAGKPIDYWLQQTHTGDVAASNAACSIVRSRVFPQLVDRMFHDVNDSRARMSLISLLNHLPGIRIYYEEAGERRFDAAECLGEFGPIATPVIPDLIAVVKGQDSAAKAAAIIALGKIHGEPDQVIPLLIPFLKLNDDSLDATAAEALGDFGSMAKVAVPKLIPHLRGKKEIRYASREALLKIDPDAAAKAGIKPRTGENKN